ncbi:hypothetical protein N7466_003102 [Penicillium verhagenii]|uniref:uncharacterized protein n=1 Tax=Penicillium verhagenii TaxID=1562060 RepID=UPI0025455DBA|nr:uncharacterized protein N7466_003102 [Penicillium verhagenii]KAJ5936652.1 hypothetical protein N7466_003102 [Penicillium verhagenii]
MSSFVPAGRIDALSLANNVKKLKTEADWRKWKEDFEILLGTYDLKCWRIFKGLMKKPDGPSRERIYNIPVMNAFLVSFYNNNVTDVPDDALGKLQKCLSEWYQINLTGCMLLNATISPEAATMISNVHDLREAYLILEKAYYHTSYPSTVLIWEKAVHLRYKKKDTAQGHLQRFQTAIQDLLAVYPNIVNNITVFHMFISSIRLHPGMERFTANLTVDTKNITDAVLADVYSRFLLNDKMLSPG